VDADDLFKRFRRELIGRNITFVRLACNSLLLYVESRPGDGQGLTFWLEPTWHISAPEGVIAGSRQAQGEGDDGPTEAELDRVSRPICEKLIDRTITEIQIDQRSRDLTVTVADAYHVRTFASHPEDDHLWHIRENSTGLTLYASTVGWRVRVGKT
jgi:hypothetical protein